MEDLSTRTDELLPVIGLTGGIGSGKSTVAQIFLSLGIPTFNADDVAKTCYSLHPELRQWVVNTFGEACGLFENGTLVDVNRSSLAAAVFKDASGLASLNARVHPFVQTEFKQWHARYSLRRSAQYVIREAAILFESGTDADCTRVITVHAHEELRTERASSRLGVTRDAVEDRIRRQWTDAERSNHAHYILENNSEDRLLAQVLRVHEQLLDELKGRR